jgi:hypothetical protein
MATIDTIPEMLTLMNEAARVGANHLEAVKNHLAGAIENAHQQSVLFERLLVTFYGNGVKPARKARAKPPRATPSRNGPWGRAAKEKRHEERLALLGKLPKRFEPQALHPYMPLRRVGVWLAACVHTGIVEAQADGSFVKTLDKGNA